MKITIDLDENYPLEKWSGDPDESSRPIGTIQDAIVMEAARQLRENLKDLDEPYIEEVRREVKSAREEAVRYHISEQVNKAIEEPIRKTNHYGEATGPTVTIREMIIDEVKRYLEEMVGDQYSSRDRMTRAQKIVKEMVDKEISRELRATMEKSKEAAIAVVNEETTRVVTEELRKRLKV